jgi:hypothetical protein
MRAGEHHDIGLLPVLLDETRLDLGLHRRFVDKALAHVGLGQFGEVFRSHQPHMHGVGVVADQVARVLPLHRPRRCQHRDQARARPFRSRLDRRHRADKRQIRIGPPERRHDDGRCCVAGDQRQGRIVAFDQSFEQAYDAVIERAFIPAAIGKAGVIGDIDESPSGHDHPCLAQNAQPANTAVKDQNRPLAHSSSPRPLSRGSLPAPGTRCPGRANLSNEAKRPRSTAISSLENPGRVSTARKLSTAFIFLVSERK